jgi:type IV pilus assembly protein PilA
MKNIGFTLINRIIMMKNKAFTLIELIAVIVVIVILAAVALPRIGNMQQAAGQAGASATAQTLQTAVQRAVTEGVITSGTAISSYSSVLTSSNSPMTGIPYCTPSDVANASFAVGQAGFPDIAITVNAVNFQQAGGGGTGTSVTTQ